VNFDFTIFSAIFFRRLSGVVSHVDLAVTSRGVVANSLLGRHPQRITAHTAKLQEIRVGREELPRVGTSIGGGSREYSIRAVHVDDPLLFAAGPNSAEITSGRLKKTRNSLSRPGLSVPLPDASEACDKHIVTARTMNRKPIINGSSQSGS
jgi:hypothetical protein